MTYLIIGLLCLFAFAALTIIAASKVQKKKREEKRGKEPAEKTSWLQTQTGKNWSTAGTLTAIYLAGFWLLYGPLANWIRSRFGCTGTEASVMVTLFGLAFVFPAVWLLYSAANIPGDPKTIKRGMRAIAFAILAVLGYFNWSGPSELFNPENGNPKFWTDKATGEIIYDPGADSSKTRFSPKTGHRLEIGNPEDIKTLKVSATDRGLVQEITDGLKNGNSVPVDIVVFTKNQRSITGAIILEVPAGTGWTPCLIYAGRFNPKCEILTEGVNTFVRAYLNGTYNSAKDTYTDGHWKNPLPDGSDHLVPVSYFKGTTKLCWERRPYTYFILVDWRA